MTAREQLDMALVGMAAEGLRPRCAEHGDRNLWTSEDADDRDEAARLCGPCPVLEACGSSADEERDVHTVRGGIDRRPSRTARAAKGATT